MMDKTVVILLSDKRSGSTMFERELCKAPGVNHVSYTPHSYNETHYWLMAACFLDMPQQLFYGSKSCKSYGSKSEIRKSLIKFICRNVSGFQVPETDMELVFDGWTAVCQELAKPVFFEKSPQHPHHWAALELMLQWRQTTDLKVYFIGLIRNPMAVQYSAEKLFRTDPEERQFSWMNACKNVLLMRELVGCQKFLTIKYESLVVRPTEEFDIVFKFVGICDNTQEVGKNFHCLSLHKWRDDPDFRLILDKSVARFANYCGYSDEELQNPKRHSYSQLKASRYRVGRFLGRVKQAIVNKVRRLKKRCLD